MTEIRIGDTDLSARVPLQIRLPLFTFILRNWNHEAFVGEAVDSIRAQNYPNFEAIVVDNGSDDRSREVIRQRVGDDARFHCIYNDENLGPLGGALIGLDRAKGDFVCIVDSDDFLFPNFASMHVQAHFAARRNVAFTSSEVLEVKIDGSLLASGRAIHGREWKSDVYGIRSGPSLPRIGPVSNEEFESLRQTLRNHHSIGGDWIWSPGTANVYRRFVLEMVRPRDRPPEVLKKLAADAHFTRLCQVCGGSAVIGTPLSAYRVHGSNISATSESLLGMSGNMGGVFGNGPTRRVEAARVLLAEPRKFAWGFASIDKFWINVDSLLGDDDAYPFQSPWRTKEVVSMFCELGPGLLQEFGGRELLRQLSKRFERKHLRVILKQIHAPLRLRLYSEFRKLGSKKRS